MKRITGHHAIEEAIKNAPSGSILYVANGSGESVKKLELASLAKGGISIKRVNRDEIEKLAPYAETRGAVLFIQDSKSKNITKNLTLDEFLSSKKVDESSLILALDGVMDPNNLGAILRSSDQFGVDLVLLPERRSCRVNETVLRISSGAASYVNVSTVTNLNSALDKLKKNGYWIYASDMKGENLYNEKFSSKSVIVMGGEDGLSELLKKRSDFMLSIPTMGHIDSLNVSVATGIMLYEYRKNYPVK